VADALDLLDRYVDPTSPAYDFLVRAQLLVHLGDHDALPAALHVRFRGGAGSEMVATGRLTLGLALLQAGRVTEAVAELEAARAAGVHKLAGSTVAVTAGLSIAYAAAGRHDEARALADAGAGQGTYLDQLQHRIGGAFARLGVGDPGAVAAFDDLVAASDATEARLDQAITRLARAHAWQALQHEEADAAMAEAQARLDALGIGAPGWSRAFALAAGA
jgi:hypothetical protein